MSRARELVEKVTGRCYEFHIYAADRKVVEKVLKTKGYDYDFGNSEKTHGYVVEVCGVSPEDFELLLSDLKGNRVRIVRE